MAKAKCGNSDAENTTGLFDGGGWSSPDPQPLVQGLPGGVGSVMPGEGKWNDTFWPPQGGAWMHWCPMAMMMMCLLISLSGRDIIAKGTKTWVLSGTFSQHPWPSAPQPILHCPMPVPVPLQAAATQCTCPPSSHPSMSIPVPGISPSSPAVSLHTHHGNPSFGSRENTES